MQLIDANDFMVRVGIFQFKHKEFSVRFVLYPMVHIGEEKFYKQVKKQIQETCDVLLYEGASLKGLKFLNYQYIAKHFGLVTQANTLSKPEGIKLIHADLSPEEAQTTWKKIPLHTRISYQLKQLIFQYIHVKFLTKRSFAKALRELNESEPEGNHHLDNFMIHQRDHILTQHIDQAFQQYKHQQQTIGILYGAAHMKKVAFILMDQYGFHIQDAEFLTVFRL